jgi:hypothetical protein
MFLERLAIAGITWVARTALSLRGTTTRKRTTRADEPVETQEVLAPDRDQLRSMGDEVGFEEGFR